MEVSEKFPPEIAKRVFTLENLVGRLLVLLHHRKEICVFLESVYAREMTFSKLKEAVSNMKSE